MLGIFSAIIVVLQLLSYTVKIGTFNLSLVLVPIVLAAVLFGPRYGAILGGVFGLVTLIAGIVGLDTGAFVLWTANPVLTSAIALLKAIAAGFLAGAVALPLKKRNLFVAVLSAAIVAPVINTAIFCAFMLLFFRDTLVIWAGGTDIIYYTIFIMTGVNFLIELGINMFLSPAIMGIIKAVRKL